LLKGKRTFIAFIVGSVMISLCLYLTRDQPANFTPLMTVWVGIQAVFVGGNKIQEKINNEKRNRKEENQGKS